MNDEIIPTIDIIDGRVRAPFPGDYDSKRCILGTGGSCKRKGV